MDWKKVIKHQCYKQGLASAGLCDTEGKMKWGEHPFPVLSQIPLDPLKKTQTEHPKPVTIFLQLIMGLCFLLPLLLLFIQNGPCLLLANEEVLTEEIC